MNANISDTPPESHPFHHGTHRQLLTEVPSAAVAHACVDAIIVSTSRTVEWITKSIHLAAALGCGVVAMCSQRVRAAEVVELGNVIGAPVIAMDVSPPGHRYGIPALATSRFFDDLRSRDIRIPFRRSDLSLKRNLGLMLAWIAGWNRVVLLDDDICHVSPQEISAAVGLLANYDVVGMDNVGYSDNSVACHALRELGGLQEQFIGAGAMALSRKRCTSFFPDIYNEDWFFMLGLGKSSKLAVTGKVSQAAYDPFANVDRARAEEFGDSLAEGLFWLADRNLHAEAASVEPWSDILRRRRYFLDDLIRRFCERHPTPVTMRRIASLRAARTTLTAMTAEMCAEYISLWQSDLMVWNEFIRLLPTDLGVDKALRHVAWPDVHRSKPHWPLRRGGGA